MPLPRLPKPPEPQHETRSPRRLGCLLAVVPDMKTTLHVVKQKRQPDTRVGLMNPEFRYVPAAATDVRATFNRVRAELARKGKA
jgi:hypothetical protein